MPDTSYNADLPARALYLHLMKRCLLDLIFIDDPLANYALYRPKPAMSPLKLAAIRVLQRFLSRYRIKLVEGHTLPWDSAYAESTFDERLKQREVGTDWPARAHTMIGRKRLDNLQYCAEAAIRDGVPGDFIETGVWRGGSCIFMRAILKAYGETERKVWVADSFAGLPPPDLTNYPADADDQHHLWSDRLAISRRTVEDNFRRYGLLDDQVRFLEGWFKDTLPTAPIERLAVLRLDGDMYESTIQALDALYHKVSPGGFIIVDDYALKGARAAIHDFRAKHGIDDTIEDIDGQGAFWRKRALAHAPA
jgi:O-methyltransferase